MPEIGIYARVSTTYQDLQRQFNELRAFAKDTYDEPEIRTYADVISGTETGRGETYQCLRSDIEDGPVDVVVVHELSRLGAGEIHEFLQFCLGHEIGVQNLEVGLETPSSTYYMNVVKLHPPHSMTSTRLTFSRTAV